jgi:general secretion pathway protein F
MRFYQYSATDASGRPATGTIRAASVDSARDALTQAGYLVSQVVDPGPQTASQQARAAQDGALRAAIATAPLSPPAPTNTGRVRTAPSIPVMPKPAETPATVQINDPAAAALPTLHKTKFGKDKDLFFLFTQLGSNYKAGVTPQTALHELALKSPERYRESLSVAEKSIGEGGSLSAVLERYPYLYSPDIVGTLRAGEISGYLAEACDVIGYQKESSHRLKRRLAYFLILFALMVFTFPLSLATVNGALNSMAKQDKAGGSLPPVATLEHEVGRALWTSLPWMLPLFAGFAALLVFWHSMPMRGFRHRLVMGFPVLSGRARAEAMSRFSWAMGMISRGGTSPNQTFQLAAETVPNLVIRQQLMDAARTMTESERLSSALRRSGSLPAEYTHIVETGETTGDVPRALSDINRAFDGDFKARDATASTFVGIMMYAGLAICVLILTIILYRLYYGGMISTVLNADT